MSAARALPEVTISESGGVRYLHLGTPWVQGAMRMDAPLAIELEYVRRMMAWTLFRDPAAVAGAHLVQLGLGTGAIARFCSRRMKMRATVVELNEAVVGACRQWFRLPEPSDVFQLVVADAGHWIADPAPSPSWTRCAPATAAGSRNNAHAIMRRTYSSSIASGVSIRMAPCTQGVPRCR